MSRQERTGDRPSHFSAFQRLIGTLNTTIESRCKMVDIDGTLYCKRCYECECATCGSNGDRDLPGILCLVEHEIFNPVTERPIEEKTISLTKRLAQRAGIPAYVIQLHIFNPKALMDDEPEPVVIPDDTKISTLLPITKFVIMRVYPTKSSPVEMTPEQLEDWFMALYDKHEKVCNHPSGMRWDREARRDVKQNAMTFVKKASS
jgi:hypothetical protein